MRGLELRGIVRMLRAPDRVVDYLLADFVSGDPDPITGDFDLAQAWTALIAPDLVLNGPILLGHGLVGIDAQLDGAPYPCQFAAEHVAIPACLVGLNRFIDVLGQTPLDRGIRSG